MHRRKSSKDTEEPDDNSTIMQTSSSSSSSIQVSPSLSNGSSDRSTPQVGRLSNGQNNIPPNQHSRHESLPVNTKITYLSSPTKEPARQGSSPGPPGPRALGSPMSPTISTYSSWSPTVGGGSPQTSVGHQRGLGYPDTPLSASPFRTSFSLNNIPESSSMDDSPPSTGAGPSYLGPAATRHLRHSRSQSGMVTSNFPAIYESPRSPLSPGPTSPRGSVPPSPLLPLHEDGSPSSIGNGWPNSPATSISAGVQQPGHHRHSRIHSRNLSIFFPRPGQQPFKQTLESEDEGQEIEYVNGGEADPLGVLIPSASTSGDDGLVQRGKIGNGFTFGSKNPEPLPPPSPQTMQMNSNRPKRRGHHHKHSVSHNFFSFMEPTPPSVASSNQGSPQQSTMTSSGLYPPQHHHDQSSPGLPEQRILPTPSTTHFPSSKTQHKFVDSAPGSSVTTHTTTTSKRRSPSPASGKKVFSALQFVLGAWMWVEGQRQGTLACTGLGYWLVFDATGVWLSALGEEWRRRPRSPRASCGSRRMETVALFAQSIYLIFAAVYVCKEAFERVLLSDGSGDGGSIPGSGDAHEHHHQSHTDPDFYGPVYPFTLLAVSTFSLFASNILYDNHSKLVEATGSHLPASMTFIQTLLKVSKVRHASALPRPPPPIFAVLRLLSNPFSVAPLCFSLLILTFSLMFPPEQHGMADVAVACLETALTFMLGYPAAVALGKVLLQTAPERGLPGGQMEAFSRVMRDLESHPQIAGVPTTHLWQLTPLPPKGDHPRSSSTSPYNNDDREAFSDEGTLVATVQLRVRREVDDADILELAQFVRERCTRALGVSGTSLTVSVARE